MFRKSQGTRSSQQTKIWLGARHSVFCAAASVSNSAEIRALKSPMDPVFGIFWVQISQFMKTALRGKGGMKNVPQCQFSSNYSKNSPRNRRLRIFAVHLKKSHARSCLFLSKRPKILKCKVWRVCLSLKGLLNVSLAIMECSRCIESRISSSFWVFT